MRTGVGAKSCPRWPYGTLWWAASVAVNRIALVTINLYRALISPLVLGLIGPACRFEPSCSAYAGMAISRHGVVRGSLMASRRLLRCRPGGGWGYDPVRAPLLVHGGAVRRESDEGEE
jgi:putative membrane protein insertion efficiency factor